MNGAKYDSDIILESLTKRLKRIGEGRILASEEHIKP